MSKQRSLDFFSPVRGKALRDEAIDRVELGAREEFMEYARRAIDTAARSGTFTTDDVWFLLEQAGVPAPREPRAMGAAMRGAAAEGRIKALNEWKLSKRPACHRRPIRIWEASR